MEAEAFAESDIDRLIDAGLRVIPEQSKLARLVRDTRRFCREEADWRAVHERILRHYGHPDCTNMFENIGITLMALLKSGGNLSPDHPDVIFPRRLQSLLQYCSYFSKMNEASA